MAPVASLVYSNGKHSISVMEMPSARPLAVPLEKHVEQAYQALTWSDGKITYWVVSDAAAEELKTFVGLFQAAGIHLNIPSTCRIASIVPKDAMILPYDAKSMPDGIFGKDTSRQMTFRMFLPSGIDKTDRSGT